MKPRARRNLKKRLDRYEKTRTETAGIVAPANDNGRRKLDPDEKYLQDVEALLANCEQCDGAGCEACDGYGLKLIGDARRRAKDRVRRYEKAVQKKHPDFEPAKVPNQTKKTRKTKKTKKRTGTKGFNKYASRVGLRCNIDRFDERSVEPHYAGRCDQVCTYCGALHWKAEQPSSGIYKTCCNGGKLKLPDLPELPPYLKSLLDGSHKDSRKFLNDARYYGNAMAFGSQVVIDRTYSKDHGGVAALKIQGEFHVYAGSLKPPEGEIERNAQLYLLDPKAAANQRSREDKVAKRIVEKLDAELRAHNRFAQMFRTAAERLEELEKKGDVPNLHVVMHADMIEKAVHARQQNKQVGAGVGELAMIISGESAVPRDLSLSLRPGAADKYAGKRQVHWAHRWRDSIRYPVMFPTGTFEGWSFDKPNGASCCEFYAYYLHQRVGQFSAIHACRRLFHEWLLDQRSKVEANDLMWYKENQTTIRADCYSGMMDAMKAGELHMCGKRIVLGPRYVGSPRQFAQSYQDAMAMIREYGRPDLFITMTCNTAWPEITAELRDGETADDRPDLVARVFKIKFEAMKAELFDDGIYGHAVAYSYSIEYQKRGLPHAHLLLILQQKIRPEQIDDVVVAELPSPKTQPRLWKIVTKHLIHNPCGKWGCRNAVCMKNGECSKGFPKDFKDDTEVPKDGYPKYRRRDNGREFLQKPGGPIVDNRWVVPYSPYLSLRYECHMNVEICASVKAAKYLYKYIHKGGDYATVSLEKNESGSTKSKQSDGRAGEKQPSYAKDYNEIKEHLEGRYLCAHEAAWRLLGFATHGQYPPVEQLTVHLENGQLVYFKDCKSESATEAAARKKLEAAIPPSTTLTAWFALNQDHAERAAKAAPGEQWLKKGEVDARNVLYRNIPRHFTLDKGKKVKGTRGQREAASTFEAGTVAHADALEWKRQKRLWREETTKLEEFFREHTGNSPCFDSTQGCGNWIVSVEDNWLNGAPFPGHHVRYLPPFLEDFACSHPADVLRKFGFDLKPGTYCTG